MLITDALLNDLPNGRALNRAQALSDRAVARLVAIPEGDRPAREYAIRVCQAAGRLTNAASARFVNHFDRLP
jgi:hypothetical protein